MEILRNDSQEFEIEQDLPEREDEKDEYIITQDQQNSVSYNSKLYEKSATLITKLTRKEDIPN